MIFKEVIGILLVSGTLQVFATDKQHKTVDISNDDFPKKGLNNFQSSKKGFKESSDVFALQFQKDKTWENKKKYRSSEEFDGKSNYLRSNEIASEEYKNKYKKHGDSFSPKIVNKKKEKSYYKKRALEKEEQEKHGSLLHDIDVNYVNNNKEVSADSEVISNSEGLLDDIDVKYINNNKEVSVDNKEVSADSEVVSNIEGLLDDIDVKHINNNKEVSGNSEVISSTKNSFHDADVNYTKNNVEISGNIKIVSNKPTFNNRENYEENYQNGNELYMKRIKKDFYQNLTKIDLTNPPPANDTILMARYIVHNVDWAVLGTLSGRSPTKGSPFVCVKATSDGVKNASSGIPFFYMSPMDLCTQDLEKDNRVSVLVTLSETEYCREQNLDPQDPRCAKLTLSGKIKKIKSGSEEEKFAKTALFTRHPAMVSWPTDHDFYFTKLKIGQIILLDQFGGATYIKVKDYLNGKALEPELERK